MGLTGISGARNRRATVESLQDCDRRNRQDSLWPAREDHDQEACPPIVGRASRRRAGRPSAIRSVLQRGGKGETKRFFNQPQIIELYSILRDFRVIKNSKK
jgi:hypothetical protein